MRTHLTSTCGILWYMNTLRLAGFVAVLAFSTPAYAAQIQIDGTATHGTFDTFYVPVRIDTQDDCINAVSVALAYDPDALSVKDVATGDSIIPLWTVPPSIARTDGKETGRVTFEGGIPGGYCGRVSGDPGLTNILAKLVVRASPRTADAAHDVTTQINVEPATVLYRNDGLGSPVPLTVLGATLTFTASTGTPSDVWSADIANDTSMPEDFDIQLVHGPSEGNQYSYIVFSTTDKQSGIDHFEVLETDPVRFGFLTWAERPAYWTPATSPYVLRDQALHSKLLVRAVDKRGNTRVVEYTPPMPLLYVYTRASILIPAAIFVGLVMLIAALIFRFSRLRREHHEHTDVTSNGGQTP